MDKMSRTCDSTVEIIGGAFVNFATSSRLFHRLIQLASVWLGGRCLICPGVTIGDNSVIGAGSVVVRDIPANRVAVGNPCRVVKEIG